uniref:N-acetylmuramoyl-L-alanine amidase AmiC n=1 Tax=Candidatus Kentrum sp. TC TaxID=2126339 RepID=A0A451A5D8_9GAMM|nr:MAG: N-acetylmuramoyl-L-alanine amidase [Candidatus Kentron sp. TC]
MLFPGILHRFRQSNFTHPIWIPATLKHGHPEKLSPARIFAWIFSALFLFLASKPVVASTAEVKNLRMWPAPDHTRVVFDISKPVTHSLFVLPDPDRLVIDIPNIHMGISPPKPSESDPLLHRIRFASHNKRRDLRIVLDLKHPVRPKSFLLKPNRNYGYRLVVDLYGLEKSKSKTPKKSASKPSVSESPVSKPPASPKPLASKPQKPKPRKRAPRKLRKVIIAVDPGHGGEDPGALGRLGTKEKDVVLAIGRKLKALLNRKRGIRAILVRDGDYYISLKKRMRIARDRKADLFISIHADAFRNPLVYGSSVYVLSRRGASSEAAKWLADKENSADLVGGVSLDDKDDVLASVLLDLSQTATLEDSIELGSKVLNELKKLGKTHKKRVQRAGFVVLKSPDIPSILVETAFISNPDEERRLRSARHQQRVAKAILTGILRYLKNNAPRDSVLAARK